ncbi:MAG: phage tail spike protein [Eubacteriales bacterium]|nr:phage tail spike protein [Eubacteriales bacterium]
MQVFNDKKKRIGTLSGFRERAITTTLDSGDKELSFEYPADGKLVDLLKEEYYIRTKTDEFVLKSVEKGEQFNKYVAVLNVEELEGTPFPYGFESQEQTIRACLTFAFEGTGWTVRDCTVTKKRTINEEESVTAWDVLQKCLSTYRCECVIDSLNKAIDIYEQIGSDKGCYFMEGLNLRKLTPKSDTYEFYTRIYPIGKDGITPEWLLGRDYIDNFQYSDKIKAFAWKDERYTNTTSLIEDATAKLEEVSRPYKAFTAEIADLAKANPIYKDILSYNIGDTVTLLSKKKRTKEKQRIVKLTEYPEQPERNTAEISNARKTFAQVQQEETKSATEEAVSISNRTTKKFLANYSTTEEVETKITASKEAVELGVLHTLESYYDKTETDSLIDISKGEIELSVSQVYQTKEAMGDYSTTAETKTLIDLATDEISLEVSKKVDGNEIISKINQSAEAITINATKINLHGTVTANENFKILSDGSMEAKNGKFVGSITGSTIQTAESGDRIVMDKSSTVRGYRNNTLYNILDMLSSGSDAQMTMDAKNQLTIRTPTLAVLNQSLGTGGGTAKVTKTGSMNVVTYVEKDKSGCKEMWVNDVYCTLPVFLSVRYTSLTTMLGMVLTGESTSTERV